MKSDIKWKDFEAAATGIGKAIAVEFGNERAIVDLVTRTASKALRRN